MSDFKNHYSLILGEMRKALDAIDPAQVEVFIDTIIEAEQVFVVGVGRVMLALQAMAKRLNHLGIRTHCVGDIGEPAITDKDVLIVGSGSGESAVPVAIARIAKKYNAKIVHIGSNPHSSIAPITDVFVRIPVITKLALPDEINSDQPMTSLFDQTLYVFGDAVSIEIANRRKMDDETLWRFHANLE